MSNINPSIYKRIETDIDNYLSSQVEISEGVFFNQYDLIKRIYKFKNKALQDKIDKLIDKMSSGDFVVRGSDNLPKDDRPQMQDVFIDPLDELDTDLDAHIEVSAAEAAGYRRDLRSDVEKLKGLLKKKKFK